MKSSRRSKERSDGEEDEDTQQPARPKQHAKEDIQISDSDLEDSSPPLNGYALNRTAILPSYLWEWCTALSHRVQSWTCFFLCTDSGIALWACCAVLQS